MSTMVDIVCPVCSKSYQVKKEPIPTTPFARWCEACLTRALKKVGRVHDQLQYKEARRREDMFRDLLTTEAADYISNTLRRSALPGSESP
jgi:hypothetical protein